MHACVRAAFDSGGLRTLGEHERSGKSHAAKHEGLGRQRKADGRLATLYEIGHTSD